MLLLCLVPCAMLFFSWFDVYVTDPAATRGLDRRFLTVYQNLPAWQRDVSPLELPSQIASGLAVCGLLLVQVCSLGPGRASSLSLLPRLILCALALLLVMAHHTDLSQWRVTVFADPETDTDTFPIETGGNFDSSGSGTSRLASLHHVILYRTAFFAFVVCIMLIFPLTITWPVTMPLAAWCLAVLYRPDVRRPCGLVERNASTNPANPDSPASSKPKQRMPNYSGAVVTCRFGGLPVE